MYILTAKADFDSAHFLLGHEGKCSNIHGHRWTIEAQISADSLIISGPAKGMIVDFSDFKTILRKLADDLDHKFIIETGSMKSTTLEALRSEGFKIVELDFRPTAENFSKYVFDYLGEKGLPVSEVKIYETPDNCATYKQS